MRRILVAVTAPLVALSLAACGPGEPPEEPTTQAETTASEDDSQPADEETPTDQVVSDDGGEDADEGDGGGSDDDATTKIELLWPDDTWTIEQVDEDLCETGGASPSAFSDQQDVFSCGSTAANALACAAEPDSRIVCIIDPVHKKAIWFESATAAEMLELPRDVETVPLLVTLLDGVVCGPISHDHDEHWQETFSWYRCTDGSELLTRNDIAGTFERGESWTVQRSTDKGEPEPTAVATAVFAGR